MKSYFHQVPDEDIEPINQFTYQFVKDTVGHLEGQMLTIVEAVLSDKEQRKSAKDLVREQFATKYNWLFEAAHFVEPDDAYPHTIVPINLTPIDKSSKLPKELKGIVIQK